MTLPITSCESERNFYKLPIIINHVRGMTELSFESVCRKSYYKRAVIRRDDQKSMASKKRRQESIIEVCQTGSRNVVILDFVMFVVVSLF
jgi:hypothetical protein